MKSKDALAIYPHTENAFWIGNRISSACDQDKIMQVESEDDYNDHYFGNTWDWTPAIDSAVYGRTENFLHRRSSRSVLVNLCVYPTGEYR